MSETVDLNPDPATQIAALQADLAAANATLVARDLLIETLRMQIARMQCMKFGASSEKLDHAIAQLELALEELEAGASTVAEHQLAHPEQELLQFERLSQVVVATAQPSDAVLRKGACGEEEHGS